MSQKPLWESPNESQNSAAGMTEEMFQLSAPEDDSGNDEGHFYLGSRDTDLIFAGGGHDIVMGGKGPTCSAAG